MNYKIKNKIEYYFPPFANDFARLLRAYINNCNYKSLIKSNKKWYNKYKNQKVYVIANGPSFVKIKSNLYSEEKVIVMNSFGRVKPKDSLKIVAHCIGEPYTSSAWSAQDIEECIQMTDSDSYWLHLSSYGKINGMNKKNKLHYVFLPYEPGVWLKRRIELHKPTLVYQTTAQLAIQVAIYMGFKEIVLLGFDHDWLASPKYLKHFYSNEKDSTDKIGEMNYYKIVKMIERMWSIYYKLNDVSAMAGVKIYNMSPNSYLDVFDVIDYETV